MTFVGCRDHVAWPPRTYCVASPVAALRPRLSQERLSVRNDLLDASGGHSRGAVLGEERLRGVQDDSRGRCGAQLSYGRT